VEWWLVKAKDDNDDDSCEEDSDSAENDSVDTSEDSDSELPECKGDLRRQAEGRHGNVRGTP
jgi:hypothetical protein